MNRLLVLTGCCVLLTVVAGCSENQQRQLLLVDRDDNGFPDCLVGVWKAYRRNWAFKFEPDGTILRMKHVLAGYVQMEEGGVFREGPDEGTYGLFVMGPCEVNYEPKTRVLEVEVDIDNYVIQVPDAKVEGRSEDYFTGHVSDDCETWQVNWRTYAWVEGATPPDPNLVEKYPRKLVFTKKKIDSSGGEDRFEWWKLN